MHVTKEKQLTQEKICILLDQEDDGLVKSMLELDKEVPPLVRKLRYIDSVDQLDDIMAAEII